MKKGFTLIELLVVVLIIGILAAVALPQYQTAVMKSRLAKVIPNVRTIITALEAYYLANGAYPSDEVRDLDISISGCSSFGSGVLQCPDENYDYHGEMGAAVGGFPKNSHIAYIEYPQMEVNLASRGTRQCWADSANNIANQVCKSMGGVANGPAGWAAPEGVTWNTYLLP